MDSVRDRLPDPPVLRDMDEVCSPFEGDHDDTIAPLDGNGAENDNSTPGGLVMSQYYLLQDQKKCIGCLSCEAHCKTFQGVPPGPRLSRIIPVGPKSIGKVPRMSYVFMPCFHCEDPWCVSVCPTGAMQKRPADGIVFVEPNLCVGCKSCMTACPWGAPQWNPLTRKVVKCNYCMDRVGSRAQTLLRNEVRHPLSPFRSGSRARRFAAGKVCPECRFYTGPSRRTLLKASIEPSEAHVVSIQNTDGRTDSAAECVDIRAGGSLGTVGKPSPEREEKCDRVSSERTCNVSKMLEYLSEILEHPGRLCGACRHAVKRAVGLLSQITGGEGGASRQSRAYGSRAGI